MLAQGDDGVWFIDYLRAFRSELDEPEQYATYLGKHLRLVLDVASKAAPKDKGLSPLALKANWLARYDNAVVAELDRRWLAAHGLSVEKLSVPADAVPTLFNFAPAARSQGERRLRRIVTSDGV